MSNEKHEPVDENDLEPCPLCSRNWRPNEETLAAMRELEEGRGKRATSIEELLADLNSDE